MAQKTSLPKLFIYIFTGSFILTALLFIPLPSVEAQSTISMDGQQYDYYINKTIDNGESLGNYNIPQQEITVASQGLGLYSFLSSCSHEYTHLQYYEGSKEPVNREIQHERMKGLSSPKLFWNWQPQCLALVDQRLAFITN